MPGPPVGLGDGDLARELRRWRHARLSRRVRRGRVEAGIGPLTPKVGKPFQLDTIECVVREPIRLTGIQE